MALKVVSAKQMARIEKMAIEKGCSAAKFMQVAGEEIAKKIIAIIPKKSKIALLLGKGNNAGDALVCGCNLIKQGFEVEAFLLFDVSSCSKLFCQNYEAFQKLKGKVYLVS